MDHANDQDHSVIAAASLQKVAGGSGQQAMHRFNLLDRLRDSLQKKTGQDEFLKTSGLAILEKWLL
jgi:hypothetical protein